MAGTFAGHELENIYNVNAAGAVAQWGSAAQVVEPFRAYFKEISTLESHNNILLPGEEAQHTAIPGDVNGDGEVTGSDVTALYNHILFGQDTEIFNGDQNGDGEVTGSDVTAVYNIILGLSD